MDEQGTREEMVCWVFPPSVSLLQLLICKHRSTAITQPLFKHHADRRDKYFFGFSNEEADVLCTMLESA